jgi:hypothetical protein
MTDARRSRLDRKLTGLVTRACQREGLCQRPSKTAPKCVRLEKCGEPGTESGAGEPRRAVSGTSTHPSSSSATHRPALFEVIRGSKGRFHESEAVTECCERILLLLVQSNHEIARDA